MIKLIQSTRAIMNDDLSPLVFVSIQNLCFNPPTLDMNFIVFIKSYADFIQWQLSSHTNRCTSWSSFCSNFYNIFLISFFNFSPCSCFHSILCVRLYFVVSFLKKNLPIHIIKSFMCVCVCECSHTVPKSSILRTCVCLSILRWFLF